MKKELITKDFTSEYSPRNQGERFSPEAYEKIPQVRKPTMKEWKEETNKVLKNNDLPERVVNSNIYYFLIVSFLIILIGGIVAFILLADDGAFKSDFNNQVNQSVNLFPMYNANTTVNNNLKNDYTFSPQTQNNITVQLKIEHINIICPNGGCYLNNSNITNSS